MEVPGIAGNFHAEWLMRCTSGKSKQGIGINTEAAENTEFTELKPETRDFPSGIDLPS